MMGLVPSTSDGPPQVPGQCLQSVALPVDARVTDKLREKIWKDEYIDFGSLLANPVYANRYQLAVQNPESGPFPSLYIEPITKAKKNNIHRILAQLFPHICGYLHKAVPS